MLSMPKDAVMLLSFVNTKLRDEFPSLSELAASYSCSPEEIETKLSAIDYRYDKNKNQFV